jgi:hypothetical protein
LEPFYCLSEKTRLFASERKVFLILLLEKSFLGTSKSWSNLHQRFWLAAFQPDRTLTNHIRKKTKKLENDILELSNKSHYQANDIRKETKMFENDILELSNWSSTLKQSIEATLHGPMLRFKKSTKKFQQKSRFWLKKLSYSLTKK